MQNSKIAIIGAGVSGLAATSMLARRGFRNVTLFEARREAGGRTRSYVDPHTGDTLDNGQHLLLGCYTSTLDYLQWAGSDHLIEHRRLAIPFHSVVTSEQVLRIPNLPAPLNLLAALWRTRLLTPIEKVAAARLGNAIARSKLPPNYEEMTCSELFATTSQPAGLVTKLWAPIILATINAGPEQVSATLFVNVIREAFFSSRGASELLIPKVGLSELLVNPALRKLEQDGIAVHFASPVRVIEVDEDGKYQVATDSDTSTFDAVIYAAAPHPTAPQPPPVVRGGGVAPLQSPMVEFSPIVNAYFWLDKKILKGPLHAFLGTTLQWVFPRPSSYSAQRLALTVSAATKLVERSNEEIRDILWADLRSAVPAARTAELQHYQIIREKRATPLFTPEIQSKRPQGRTEFPRFFLAGDFVQNGLPATIEGAVRNGYAAAELLMMEESSEERANWGRAQVISVL